MKLKLNIKPVSEWLPGLKHPLVIAGPCSAESEIQVAETAIAIKEDTNCNVYRAGIWKPRTRPDCFEGVGEQGLQWLKAVKTITGMYTATEVANAGHVEACLKHGIDILWIGARTTVNPFQVQEIADALKGTDAVVLVKNPVHADIQLWAGALERVNKAGITKLGAIHRGFHAFESAPFRNIPLWQLVIELRTACKELPIICDPSHICGNTELIPYISQKAMDMALDGLMIETHIQPGIAKSDAKQQLTPLQLKRLLNTLILRKPDSESAEFKSSLEALREKINSADEQLLLVLSQRIDYSKKIGEYKKANNITILQVNRWEELLKNRMNLGQVMGLNSEFVKEMYSLIHEESIQVQTEIMNVGRNNAIRKGELV